MPASKHGARRDLAQQTMKKNGIPAAEPSEILNQTWLLAAVIASIVGLAVATRPDGIGTDTENYRAHFFKMVTNEDYTTRYEPAFELIMRMVADLSGSPEALFGLIYGLLLVAMVGAMAGAVQSVPRSDHRMFPLAALGLLFISSWFITGSTNGMRQGLSLGVFYLGATLILFRGKWLVGLALIGVSPLFHLSTVLLWPVLVAAPILPLWLIVVLFLTGAAAYTFGMTKYLVLVASEVTGIPAYDWVINYVPDVSRWEGWQADLFAYTVGWAVIYMACRFLVPKQKRSTIDMALKIYMLACFPYFVFGFGNFSNRYGTMAWMFLPIMHALWIFTAKLDNTFKTALALMLLISGIGRYGLYLSGVL